MASGGSITHWIAELKSGDESALERLRQRYWPYLVGLAHKKLAAAPRLANDDEDVAQEAFWGFYRSFRAGRVPRLENREHLLALLTIITARRAANHIEWEGRIKRGEGQVQGESALEYLAASSTDARGIDQVADSGLSPQDAASATDLYDRYLNALPEDLRDIARQYLANCSTRDISAARGCAVRTVERKIEIILREWQKMAAQDVDAKG